MYKKHGMQKNTARKSVLYFLECVGNFDTNAPWGASYPIASEPSKKRNRIRYLFIK